MGELLEGIERTGLATWVRESPTLWAYPTILFFHTAGLGFLVGPNVAIDLRLLGFPATLPLAPMRRLYPVMWAGFWLNALSGVALLAADATTKLLNPVFGVKLACVAIGVMTMAVHKRRALDRAASGAVPGGAMVATASLVAWVGATVAGRLMGYLGPVAGLE